MSKSLYIYILHITPPPSLYAYTLRSYTHDVDRYLCMLSERMSSYTFLFKQNSAQARKHLTPVRWMQHSSLFMGERTMKNNVPGMPQESGYQAMRLATELFPATFAMIGAKNISPFWSVLFYFVLIMFGIGQQVCFQTQTYNIWI